MGKMFNCQMKHNFEERKPNFIPPLGAEDVKKIAIYQYQGPQYCHLQHGHLPPSGSIALNDMSKQVQVLPSSFFSPGTVPGPGSQQYQSSISGSSVAVPGHGHCTQQPALVQQSQSQQVHPWAQNSLQQNCHNHRQPAPHQWTRSAQLNVVTPTPSNQYGNQVQNMVYPHLVNPFNSQLAAQQTMFMASSPLPMAVNYGHQRSQYTPQPQYAISSSQQMYISSGPSTYNYTVSQSPMYYQQLSTQRYVSGCPFPVNGQSGNSSGIKKEKSIIRIGDPVTGRDVTEEVLLNKENSIHPDFQDPGETSNESSRNSHEIVVQFTAKVAALATLNANNKSEAGVSSSGVMISDSQNREINGLSQVDGLELTKQDALRESKIKGVSRNGKSAVECYDSSNGNSVGSSAANELNTESRLNFIGMDIICSEDKTVNTVLKSADPSHRIEYVEPVDCGKTETDSEKDNHILCGSDINIYAQDTKQDTELSSSQCNEDAYAVHVSENESDHLPNEVYSAGDSLASVLVQSEATENILETTDQAQPSAVSSSEFHPTQVTETAPCEEGVMEAKESRKNKGKRKKDLNKKGENKEGGDMDAFLDKNEEICIKTPPSPPSSTKISSLSLDDQDSALNDKLEEIQIIPDKKEEYNIVYSEEEKTLEEKTLEENDDHSKLQAPLTLKYNYKEDQWSPLNPEGKKHYDREFLLHLQSQPMSLRKPSNLPNLEVIKDKAIHHRLPDIIKTSATPLQPRPPDLFIPHFVGGRSARPPHSGISRRQSQQGRDKPKKIITISTSLNQDVKLHESENAWKPSMLTVQNDTEELYRRVKGILNKLTPQKFQTLVSQVKQLEINTEERLKGVIDLVFEKAVDEPNFSVPYANMCKQLALLKVPIGKNAEGHVNFRKLLLTKCQREFEKDHSDETRREEKLKEIEQAETPEKKRQLKEALEEEERQSRRRSLGNIRFIGELFKLGMLIEPIMHGCVNKLLTQGDEDSLECLCRLLTTIGKELEDNVKKSNKVNPMDEYFKEMKKIIDKRQVTPRVKFMLQDVIELRQNSWVPRWNENNPKTIDQIHREAEQEAHEKQQFLQQVPFQQRSTDRDRRKSRSNPPLTDESWTMSTGKNKANYSVVDPMKLKLTKPAEVENIQLQPGNRPFSNWRCGSSGGGKSSEQDVEVKTSVLSNRFLPLTSDQSPNFVPKRASQRSTASSRESSRGRGNQPPFPSVRKTPSQISSKEREQLLEAVKDFARSGTIEQKPVDNKKAILPPEINEMNSKKTDSVLKGGNLSRGEIEKKTSPLIDEFLHNCDFEEAIQCVTELVSLSTIHIFISAAINHVLERSSQARHLLGELLHKLLKKNIIYLEQYVKGLKEVLEIADDCAIDVPMIWEYLGELIEPVIEDNSVSLSFLKEAAKPLIISGSAGKLVASVLLSAVKKRGTIKVGELWRDSGLKWSDFLGSEENVPKFIENLKLEFTVHCMDVHPVVHLSTNEVKKQLHFLLQKKQADNEEIFDWIEANVGEKRTEESWFIRALITAVIESAIVVGEDASSTLDHKKIKHRISLLQRYLDHREHLEIQALYALQALMDQLHHPKGLLKHIFDTLYDEDLISEDAFRQWEKNDDPAERGGKGVALLSVNTFFKWLQETDEESSNEN